MYSVLFLWPSNDVEEEAFQKFGSLDDAVAYGRRKMETMPCAVICVVVRPGRTSIRIWWETHHLVSNYDEIEATEPSLAQKLDWRKHGF